MFAALSLTLWYRKFLTAFYYRIDEVIARTSRFIDHKFDRSRSLIYIYINRDFNGHLESFQFQDKFTSQNFISHSSTRTQTEQLERLKIEYFLFRVIFLWEVDATQSWPAISHTFDLMDSPGPFSIRRDAGETPPPPLSPLLFFPFFVPRIICPLSRLFGNNGDTLHS